MRPCPAASIRVLTACFVCGGLSAQAPVPPRATAIDATGAAQAILHWAAAFQRGHIAAHRLMDVHGASRRKWVRLGLTSNALDGAGGALSPMAMLHQLLDAVERHPRGDTARALLALASIGLDHDMFDPSVRAVRDLGHFALLRSDDPALWHRVHEIAIGTDPALPIEPTFEPGTEVLWRVAAILAVGAKKQSVFRSTIEKGLVEEDARIRLASAEALTGFAHVRSLPAVTAALAREDHPVAALQMVTAVQRILDRHAEQIAPDVSGAALSAVLQRLGAIDWRTDMAIVRLVTCHPTRDAVLPMIALMRNARGEPDPILKIVNRRASRLLAARAQVALEQITGARMGDDPGRWQAFWHAEKDRIIVRRRSTKSAGRTSARPRRGGFFGIPVLGNNVVFVIDTSGSMNDIVVSKVPRRRTAGKTAASVETVRGSRLTIACQQALRAVQGMPEHARFSIVSFSSTAHRWNTVPVRACAWSRATAARIFAKLRPGGGTNLYDALAEVLEVEGVGYGDPVKGGVDEIFVLTDGLPTSGRMTDPGEILDSVRAMNSVRRARIHAVFAGKGEGAALLRRLARDNGGVFVQT